MSNTNWEDQIEAVTSRVRLALSLTRPGDYVPLWNKDTYFQLESQK